MKKIIVLTLAAAFSFYGCSDKKILTPEERISKVDLSVSGLNDPGTSIRYEAWFKWLNKTSAGDFEEYLYLGELAANGADYSLNKSVNLGYIQGGLSVIIVMELDSVVSDTASEPGPYRIIGAQLEANTGTFRIGSDDILDFDFSSASGTFFLDTPTQNPPSSTPKSGIWFGIVDTTSAVIPGLYLQDLTMAGLSSGWSYEGWIMFGTEWLSTGTFKKYDVKDEAAPYSGFLPGYNLPGEDFIRNAPAGLTFPTDLSGRDVKITLTPSYPPGASAPFIITIFAGQIPETAETMQNYPLENVMTNTPYGSLAITTTLYK